jgi:hypothetical protein
MRYAICLQTSCPRVFRGPSPFFVRGTLSFDPFGRPRRFAVAGACVACELACELAVLAIYAFELALAMSCVFEYAIALLYGGVLAVSNRLILIVYPRVRAQA